MGQLNAFNFHGAAARIGAGQRLEHADLDGVLGKRRAGNQQHGRKHDGKNLLHVSFPLLNPPGASARKNNKEECDPKAALPFD